MKKKGIMISLIVSLFLISGLSIWLYSTIRSPLAAEGEDARSVALNHDLLTTVSDVSHYYGGDSYWVLEGTNDDGEDQLLFLHEDYEESDEYYLLSPHEGVEKSEMVDTVSQELNVTSFESIRLGVENGQPVYEFTYVTNGSRVFYYTLFETGAYLKSYSIHTAA
ncbi:MULTISPECIES: cell wall elongation regulator TseB-like domain-containing protein [Bacillaceae]|uniref:Cell wall elongation regulator TseB-like domain-containing protein n=2 Tax=Bacillaceae TaxID=186817 RepID=A0A9D5DNF3_9BACI|nr:MULTISPECIES: DUF5590 domain-containing protein [Bacillaceae]KQL51869.1 hypothetical protein AN965_19110 [Alkalicoccobacillus plakortidis]MBG9784537.1 hypothetical protein [Shouchella lehensis]RQW20442.1 hypothetical protein EH196_10015 [Bacillus sp. C1-1]TES50456.1 hypothetical protein E2L03_00555 [Shouchella lehensis]